MEFLILALHIKTLQIAIVDAAVSFLEAAVKNLRDYRSHLVEREMQIGDTLMDLESKDYEFAEEISRAAYLEMSKQVEQQRSQIAALEFRLENIYKLAIETGKMEPWDLRPAIGKMAEFANIDKQKSE